MNGFMVLPFFPPLNLIVGSCESEIGEEPSGKKSSACFKPVVLCAVYAQTMPI
jgi:hypothetical protein